jgi:hypothetical protein
MSNKKAPSIAVAIPSGDSVPADFWMSFTFSVMRWQQLLSAGTISRFEFRNVRSANLAESREQLARWALDGGFSHVLWVDSDMTFPSWALERLLSQKRAIIGASYRMRAHAQGFPTTFTKHGGAFNPCWPLEGNEPLEVDGIGCGLLLVKTDVYRKLAEPWYSFEYLGGGKYLSEDLRFCDQAKAGGFKVFCDPVVSRWTGHAGFHTYTFASVEGREPTREEFLARQHSVTLAEATAAPANTHARLSGLPDSVRRALTGGAA